MLLSFERPRRPSPAIVPAFVRAALSGRPLKTAQQPQPPVLDKRGWQRVSPAGSKAIALARDVWDPASDHRQDSKGMWWMPWHLESKKGVDDCDKPR
jgi:hypothetical protein